MPEDDAEALTVLECVLPDERIYRGRSHREQYASDASIHPASLPTVVAVPHSTEEISAILERANERGVPVTPWAGGSSLEGNPIPIEGGIALDVTELDHVEVRVDDLQVVVGPGVIYDELNEGLARFGLRFPPGISSGDVATIGGMIANNASGFNAVRYGVTRRHVRRLEVVLPDGRIIECGRDVVKTAAGYSLKDLFVGSEGTLGVITEATLGLAAVPAERYAALATFPNRQAASKAVTDIMTSGIIPGAIEFMDELTIRMVNAYTDIGLEETPTLLIELHGNEGGLEEDVPFTRSICKECGATDWWAAGRERSEKVWTARREALPSYRAYRDELKPVVLGDVVVPISKYPDLVSGMERLAHDFDLLVPTVGHAGDGNLHFTPLVDTDDPDARERGLIFGDRVAELTLELGGSVTGEHGIGIGKRKFMEAEHGAALDVMRAIKRAIDPNGIMNPGKVLPDVDGDPP